jgi:hypothetical protein
MRILTSKRVIAVTVAAAVIVASSARLCGDLRFDLVLRRHVSELQQAADVHARSGV